MTDMTDMTAIDVMDEACRTVSGVVQRSARADLSLPTPCGWDLRTLANHFAGTCGALARVGQRQALDPDHPWGSDDEATGEGWATTLADRVTDLATSWSQPAAWQGSVAAGGPEMPAQSLGEMALVEVVLHGWDLARATGRELQVSPALAREVLRSVTETSELGRRMGAYGPEVEIPVGASDLDRALGAAGRDPGWQP